MERALRLNWQEFVTEAIHRRKMQGLTQEQLASIVGVSKPTLIAFEAGKTTLTLENAHKILKALALA